MALICQSTGTSQLTQKYLAHPLSFAHHYHEPWVSLYIPVCYKAAPAKVRSMESYACYKQLHSSLDSPSHTSYFLKNLFSTLLTAWILHSHCCCAAKSNNSQWKMISKLVLPLEKALDKTIPSARWHLLYQQHGDTEQESPLCLLKPSTTRQQD